MYSARYMRVSVRPTSASSTHSSTSSSSVSCARSATAKTHASATGTIGSHSPVFVVHRVGDDGLRLAPEAERIERCDTETEQPGDPAVGEDRPGRADPETDLVRQLDVRDADAEDRRADQQTDRMVLRTDRVRRP